MTYSYTTTSSNTFTVTHARYIAAKVATDLKRIQRFYNVPSDRRISEFEEEVVKMLNAGYLEKVTYGFKLHGEWIEPTLEYTAKDLTSSTFSDDDPGRICPGCNVAGATFYSFLEYSQTWFWLSEQERANFEKTLPFIRTNALKPNVRGRMISDLTYSAGGRALKRASARN